MEKHLTPVMAIRKKCVDCCCGVLSEVRECSVIACPLHKFRMGTNPNYTRTEKQTEPTPV